MPTLRPQTFSGLVVIPTVELDGNIYRVSIAINGPGSRGAPGAPPPEVASREDLVVELRNPSEGSLEPIASPDPGPLPVRALRVVQARGEFTFAKGVNAATELTVAVQGDRKSFPMSDTIAPTRCLTREPNEGDRFPGAPPGGGPAVLSRILRVPLPPILKPRCCVRRFEAPLNAITDLAVKSEFFHMEADFHTRGRRCRCSCCEYRQFVRGSFSDSSGTAVRFDLPSGALDPANFCEDGATDEFGPGRPGYYGHRDTSTPGDVYSGAGAVRGCTYAANETPSCPPTEGAHLEFIGLIVDRCRGVVAAKRTWLVDL
ncbi:MAG TPA: hypothetical protein VGC98_13940 [Thermoleophilaceae bacterium]